MYTTCHTLAVGIVLSTQVFWSLACPGDAVNEVFLCLSNLTSGIHEDGKKLGADSYIIERKCRTGEFQSAIVCVDGVFHKCRDYPELMDLLKKLADPQNIREAFQVLCGNLELYTRSSNCMMEQDAHVQPCFKAVEGEFNRNLLGSRTVNEEIMTFCGFQTGVQDCIILPVSEACGSEIGKLLLTFMKGVTSPVCHDKPSSGSLQLTSGYSSAMFFLIVLCRL